MKIVEVLSKLFFPLLHPVVFIHSKISFLIVFRNLILMSITAEWVKQQTPIVELDKTNVSWYELSLIGEFFSHLSLYLISMIKVENI